MKKALLAVLAAAGLSGCVYDDYGTGLSLGYASSYGGYGYEAMVATAATAIAGTAVIATATASAMIATAERIIAAATADTAAIMAPTDIITRRARRSIIIPATRIAADIITTATTAGTTATTATRDDD